MRNFDREMSWRRDACCRWYRRTWAGWSGGRRVDRRGRISTRPGHHGERRDSHRTSRGHDDAVS